MEPYRLLIDRLVYDLRPKEMNKEARLALIGVLNRQVSISQSRQCVSNAIKIYCKSVFRAVEENDMEELRFYRDEL